MTYTVSENPVIQTIKFTTNAAGGKPSVPFSELTAQMNTQPGQILNANILLKDLNNLFNRQTGYVVKQGHLLYVSGNPNIDPKTGILIIPLAEYYIQSIKITGNSRVKTEDILAQMHTKAGDLYDGMALNNDEGSIYEMGEFRQVKNYTIESSGADKISITIPVVEQPAATGTLDQKQGKVIPFLYDPLTNPLPVVQVSVNGKPPLPFIVDTGTSAALSLDLRAAKELGIAEDGPVEKNNVNIAYQKVPIQGFVIEGQSRSGGVASDTRQANILDLSFLHQLSHGQHIAGIIGLEMLAPFTSRFDLATKTLTIFSEPHAPLHIPGGILLPLRGNTYGNFLVRATLAPDTYADLILDTGSDSTQVPLSALEALHPTAASYSSFYTRLDATYICPTLRLPKLDLGALTVPNVVVGTLPPPTRLSLGMDILAGYRMTLDGPNGQLILEPYTGGGRYVSGWSGVNIKQADQGWKVTALRGNSPARLAGLQVGDLIVNVDSIRVNGLTVLQSKYLLGGISGRLLQVSAKRGTGLGKNIVVSWTLLDGFSAPTDPTDGLALEKAPGGPWILRNILPGCPGDLAGLQVGDAITQVQGEAVAKMPINRYGDLVRQTVVVLEIGRAGAAKPFTVRLSVPK